MKKKSKKLVSALLTLAMVISIFAILPPAASAADDKPYYVKRTSVWDDEWFDRLYLALQHSEWSGNPVELKRNHTETFHGYFGGSLGGVSELKLNGYTLNYITYPEDGLKVANGAAVKIWGPGYATFSGQDYGITFQSGIYEGSPIQVYWGAHVTFIGGKAGALVDTTVGSRGIGNVAPNPWPGTLSFQGRNNGHGIQIIGANPRVVFNNLENLEIIGAGNGHGILCSDPNASPTLIFSNISYKAFADASIDEGVSNAFEAVGASTILNYGPSNLTFCSGGASGIFTRANTLTLGGTHPIYAIGSREGINLAGTGNQQITVNTTVYATGEGAKGKNSAGIHVDAPGLTLSGTGSITAKGEFAGIRMTNPNPSTLTANVPLTAIGTGNGDMAAGIRTYANQLTLGGSKTITAGGEVAGIYIPGTGSGYRKLIQSLTYPAELKLIGPGSGI